MIPKMRAIEENSGTVEGDGVCVGVGEFEVTVLLGCWLVGAGVGCVLADEAGEAVGFGVGDAVGVGVDMAGLGL